MRAPEEEELGGEALVSPVGCVFSRSFTCLCYSADGESVLAGGLSKFVCIYNVREQLLVKKFEISSNLSFDAMEVSQIAISPLRRSVLSDKLK